MIELPIKIESTLNKREHWSTRAKRAASQRDAARWGIVQHMPGIFASHFPMPEVIRLTRIAPRELDTDNLAGGFKSVRDGVADWMGIKDNDPRVTWQYAQAKGKPKQYAVRIEFLPAPNVAFPFPTAQKTL